MILIGKNNTINKDNRDIIASNAVERRIELLIIITMLNDIYISQTLSAEKAIPLSKRIL